MAYRVKKSIPQYSLVDIFEILLNKNHPEFAEVKKEFEKRKPSEKEIEIAKKGLEIRLKTRNKPLTFWDKLYCFLVPFLYSNNSFDNKSAHEEFADNLAELEMYGESRRAEELKKWQTYSSYFYLSLIAIVIIGGIIISIIANLYNANP